MSTYNANVAGHSDDSLMESYSDFSGNQLTYKDLLEHISKIEDNYQKIQS